MSVIFRLQSNLSELKKFVSSIGSLPDAVFDDEFHGRLREIDHLSHQYPEKRRSIMAQFLAETANEFEHGNMCRHSRIKPFGYAGDHLLIDMIYQQCIEETGLGNLLDEFYHRQLAPQAVRNRKAYFVSNFNKLCNLNKAPSVLDMACGPCRDVAEALVESGETADKAFFHCIDLDSHAISYANTVVGQQFASKIRWQQTNAFRLRTNMKYDLVWSAGLYDYLDDRWAAHLLRKMWGWIAEGGEVIVGNFHLSNPDRALMEWCGDWHLIHRNEDDMLRICRHAGIPEEFVSFEYEPLGINMFLKISKG